MLLTTCVTYHVNQFGNRFSIFYKNTIQFNISISFFSELQVKSQKDSRTSDLYDDDQKSVRDMYLDRVTDDAVGKSLQVQERVCEQIRINRRFTEINRQITDFSSLARVLIERGASSYSNSERSTSKSREENGKTPLLRRRQTVLTISGSNKQNNEGEPFSLIEKYPEGLAVPENSKGYPSGLKAPFVTSEEVKRTIRETHSNENKQKFCT